MHGRKKLRRNPGFAIAPDFCECKNPGQLRRAEQTPFLHSVETSSAGRVYTFQPARDKKFEIMVEFPISEYGEIPVEVSGQKIAPDHLIEAVNFVQRNEMQFMEAFEMSVERAPAPPITETVFQGRPD